MPTVCPKCGATIPADDVNVAKDIAFCRKCDKGFALSELLLQPGAVDLTNPPRGAWYRDDGATTRIGATLRSGIGVFFGLFALTWTLGLLVLAGFLVLNWARPGTVTTSGPNPQPLSNEAGLLFTIPMVLTSVVLGIVAAVNLFGRLEVCLRAGDRGEIFTGLGSIGWRRRFDPATVTGVTVRPTNWTVSVSSGSGGNSSGGRRLLVACLDGPDLRFGAILSDARRAFVAGALRKALGV